MRKNEALAHPGKSTEQPINVSIQKVFNSQGQHVSAVTFSDAYFEESTGKKIFIIYNHLFTYIVQKI